MRTDMTLTQLAAEIQRRQQSKRDYVARQDVLRFAVSSNDDASWGARLAVGSTTHALPLTVHAHGQLASHYGVPRAYYDRMLAEAPGLWRDSLQTWAGREGKATRMVRTLDDQVRAFLSPRYRRIDDFDVAEATLPVIAESLGGDVRVESCALTPTRMWLKAFWPALQAEVKKGDVVQAGIMVRNSEVGAGALEVAPYLLRLVCLNGMKVHEFGQRRAHVGRHLDFGEEDAAAELYSDETKRKDDEALLAKVTDTVRAVADESRFMLLTKRLREAAEDQRITGNPEAAVEVLAQRHNLTEATKGSVLRNLVDGGDLSCWGLSNAVTAAANAADDYEAASALEDLGGRIIALDRGQWRELAEAA